MEFSVDLPLNNLQVNASLLVAIRSCNREHRVASLDRVQVYNVAILRRSSCKDVAIDTVGDSPCELLVGRCRRNHDNQYLNHVVDVDR